MSHPDGLFWALCLVALCFLAGAIRYYPPLSEERSKAREFERLLACPPGVGTKVVCRLSSSWVDEEIPRLASHS